MDPTIYALTSHKISVKTDRLTSVPALVKNYKSCLFDEVTIHFQGQINSLY